MHLSELGHRQDRGFTAFARVGAPRYKRTDGVKTEIFTYAVNFIHRTWQGVPNMVTIWLTMLTCWRSWQCRWRCEFSLLLALVSLDSCSDYCCDSPTIHKIGVLDTSLFSSATFNTCYASINGTSVHISKSFDETWWYLRITISC
jgi:hypothetical protein